MGIANDVNKMPSEKFVLRKFRKNEHDVVSLLIDVACDALEFSLNHSIQETMNKYNRIIEGEKNNE